MCAAFFIRVRPASRKAKPACMNMTRTAATTTQTVFIAISSLVVHRLILQTLPVRWWTTSSMGDVQQRPSPDRGRCGRRRRSPRRPLGERVLDDEDEERLRQEARLEDPAAVLVGDAALRPCPIASTTVTPTWPVSSSTASITVSTRSLMTTASTLTTAPSFLDHEKSPATTPVARPHRLGGPPAPAGHRQRR